MAEQTHVLADFLAGVFLTACSFANRILAVGDEPSVKPALIRQTKGRQIWFSSVRPTCLP
jgi:hypothetical protein